MKPWYQSKTIIGGVTSILVMASFLFEVDLGDTEATKLVQAVFGAIGAILTIYGRLSANDKIK